MKYQTLLTFAVLAIAIATSCSHDIKYDASGNFEATDVTRNSFGRIVRKNPYA